MKDAMRGFLCAALLSLASCAGPGISGALLVPAGSSSELVAGAGEARVLLHNAGPGEVRVLDRSQDSDEVRLGVGEEHDWPGPVHLRVEAEGADASVRFRSLD